MQSSRLTTLICMLSSEAGPNEAHIHHRHSTDWTTRASHTSLRLKFRTLVGSTGSVWKYRATASDVKHVTLDAGWGELAGRCITGSSLCLSHGNIRRLLSQPAVLLAGFCLKGVDNLSSFKNDCSFIKISTVALRTLMMAVYCGRAYPQPVFVVRHQEGRNRGAMFVAMLPLH